MDWRRTEALAAIGAKAPSEFARLEAIPPDDSEILGGPSGIRTQDRRIKSQWLQPQKSRGKAPKTPENGGFRPKEHATTQVQPTFQIQSMTNMTRMRECKRRSQAKSAHIC